MKDYYSKNNLISDEKNAPAADRIRCERRRTNLKMIFDNTTIIPFKWRGTHTCFYCSVPVSDYAEFRKHTKSHGRCNVRTYAMRKLKGSTHETKLDVSEITCKLCEKQFKSLEVIVEHLINEHNKFYDRNVNNEIQQYRLVDLRCMQCDQQFDMFRRLVAHVNDQHPTDCYICHDCGRKFNKKRDISSHMHSSHRVRGWVCKQCGLECTSRYEMRTHAAQTHLTRCHVCGKQFTYLTSLFKHVKHEHPDDENKTCNYCLKEFHSPVGMKQHMYKCKVKSLSEVDDCTDAPIKSINPSRTRQEIVRIRENIRCVLNMSTAVPFKFRVNFSCFYCGRKIHDYDLLKQHTITEHPACELKMKAMKKLKGKRTMVRVDIASLACKLCSTPMENLESFIDHAISTHHADYDKAIKLDTCFESYRLAKGNIPCLECPKVFRYLNTMLRHFNSDHSNNNVICDYCGRGFRTTSNLKMHLRNTHAGEVECALCHIKFKNRSALSRHAAKSHHEKTAKCGQCTEKFESTYKRQLHLIKVHGIGHKCEYCGKMFTKHSFMDAHVRRTHLKEKNVACSVCGAQFFDIHLLKMHMVKHDGERKFKCELCGKAFLRQKNLRTHMDTHKKYGFAQ